MSPVAKRLKSAVHSGLELVHVRAMRTATYELLQQQLRRALEDNRRHEEARREDGRRLEALERGLEEGRQCEGALRQQLERTLEESRQREGQLRERLGKAVEDNRRHEEARREDGRRLEALERGLEEGRQREGALRQQLERTLEDSRVNLEKVAGLYNALRHRVETSLVVPLHYPEVVRRRPPTYRFEEIARRFERHAEAMGRFLAALLPVMYSAELERVPAEKAGDTEPYWNNGFFSGDDARLAYAVAVRHEPRTILEIGSGNSTKFFRKAIADHGLRTRLVSIDPQPRAEIAGIADRILFQSVLDVPPATFRDLRAGDVLFIDGSHLVFNGTDVVYCLLELFPALAEGVLVHIHDIALPFEYDSTFSDRCYNEQYMLAMLLLYADDWVPLAPVHYLKQKGLLRYGGGSFWMKRGQAEPGPVHEA
jgi:hypothetical protein